jgi:hypothetical protein
MTQSAPEFRLEAPYTGRAEDTFLAAWKKAIALTNHRKWFGVSHDLDLERAPHKDALRPRVVDINKGIHGLPASEACLIAAMVGFYNPAEGARLAGKLHANGLGDLVGPLNPAQRIAVGMLIINYQGW